MFQRRVIKTRTDTRTCCLTRVQQDDGLEADKLLGFEFEHAETGSGGQQHVEDLRHPFHAVAFVPGCGVKENTRKHLFQLPSLRGLFCKYVLFEFIK